MEALKQCVSWWCFVPRLCTPDAFARMLVDLGYDAIDLLPQEYWPLARSHGLAISSCNGHASIERGLNRREEHDRIEQELLANIELARQWEIAGLVCFSGSRAGLDDETGAEITAEGLRRVAGAAEKAGVQLWLELLNSKVDHPDYQADSTAWGVKVCQMVDSPNVRLLYDIYHMQINEGDLIRTIREAAPYIGHYHTAGNPGRHEIGRDQEINYQAVFRAIAETGYTGYVGHEFIPTGKPFKALAEAHAIVTAATRAS